MALNDGTPGCEGVLIPGKYDPRFDIETDEFEPFGFIYLITNLVNGKLYVGQTTKTVEERWNGHVREANAYINGNKNKRRKKIHVIDIAIGKYGVENFEVEKIECCLIRVIDDREIHWIKEYDCCILDGKEKGYNISRGGKGFKRYILDEKEIARLYYSGVTPSDLSKQFKTCESTIRAVLSKNGFELRSLDEVWELQRIRVGQTVLMLDDEGQVVKTFNSQAHAGDWAVEQGLTTSTSKAARTCIRTAFLKGHKAYGYHWRIEGIDEEELEKQRARIFAAQHRYDKKKSLINKAAQWSQNKKQDPSFGCKPKPSKPHLKSRQPKKNRLCAHEGCSEPRYRHSKYCSKHFHKPYENHCPEDLNEVVALVCKTSFREAGKHYGVTDSSVRKWLKAANIPTPVKELEKYAIENHIIEDPVENMPHAEIYERFRKHGGIRRTALAFHCSNEMVIRCCLKHGMTEEEIQNRNEEAKKKNIHKRVASCDKDGNIIAIYETIGEASKMTGVARIRITEECKGHRKTRRNWKFVD